ncbi:MAG: alpha/beta hydrolase [bacterium]|nr:alpha/beta hydrolase [bacterium]MBU1918269.1 alpha/beta hydrolase [bacterium]
MPVKKTNKIKRTIQKAPKLKQLIDTKEGYATSFDGTRIWYQTQGEGIPIILCNGLGCSLFFWKHIISHLKKNYRIIVFDWRCHGKSESTYDEEKMTVDALTQDLRAVMTQLKIKQAIIMGHSMGTQIMFNFYGKYPKKVLALISCCSTFGKPMDTFYNSHTSKYVFAGLYIFNHLFPKVANKIGFLLGKNPFYWQMGTALRMLNPGLADRSAVKEYIEHFTSMDSAILTDFAKSLQDYNAEPTLKRVKVPTLIIAGEDDTFTPVWLSKKMHHLIPHSELMVIKKASHIALIEQPALINLRIEKFLSEKL